MTTTSKIISFIFSMLISLNVMASEDIINRFTAYTSSVEIKNSFSEKQIALINSEEFRSPIIKRINDLTKGIENNDLIVDHLIQEHLRSRYVQILIQNIINSPYSEQIQIVDANILIINEFGCRNTSIDLNKSTDRYKIFYDKLLQQDRIKVDLYKNKFDLINSNVKIPNFNPTDIQKTNGLIRKFLEDNKIQFSSLITNPCLTLKTIKKMTNEVDKQTAEIAIDQYYRFSLLSASYNLSPIDEKYNRQSINIKCPKNEYPSVAKSNNMEGTAVMSFSISKNGEVLKNEITSSTKHQVLDEYLLENTKKCLFVPSYIKGNPTNSELKMRFVFRLED